MIDIFANLACMSPIEHIWDMVGWQLVRHGPPPIAMNTLWIHITNAWREIPQEHIHVLFDSRPQHLKALIAAQ